MQKAFLFYKYQKICYNTKKEIIMDNIRLSREALLDLQRTIVEAKKQSLHQLVEDQQSLINTLNRTTLAESTYEIKNKLEETNTALRILATMQNKIIDILNQQTEILEKLAKNEKSTENEE